MKKIRIIFKLLFYAKNQSMTIRPQMISIIQALVKENKCETSILYKEGLKTNFSELIVLEVYFKSRYGAQLKKVGSFEGVQSSLQLFSDSLDKQYGHEYFW